MTLSKFGDRVVKCDHPRSTMKKLIEILASVLYLASPEISEWLQTAAVLDSKKKQPKSDRFEGV